jgi:hypothetical protein
VLKIEPKQIVSQVYGYVKESTYDLCDCEPQQISKEEENPIAPASFNKKDTVDKIIIDQNY